MSSTETYRPSKEEAWVLLSYIFNKVQDPEDSSKTIWSVIYPPTQKPFSEKNAESLVKLLTGQLKKDIEAIDDSEKATAEEMNKAQIPIYEAVIPQPSGDKEADEREYKKNQEELRLKFQNIVRRFLRSEKNPATQLAFLNKIQRQTKFHLFNPDGSRKAQRSKHGSSAYQSLKYGYADLLRFLCEPVKSGEVARLTQANPIGHRYVVDNENGEYIRTYKGEYVKANVGITDGKTRYRKEATTNPFYNPIQYDVPDERGNELLERLYVGARQYYAKKVAELAYLKKELLTKPSKERRRSILENMLLIFRQIHDNRFDPIHLSKQIKGQQRPMETYRNEHFYELLEQMSTRKRLAPASVRERPPKGNTGFSLTNPTLDNVEKKTTKHHKRRRSKKHGHSKRSSSHTSVSSSEEEG